MNKIDNSQNITIKDSENVKFGNISHSVNITSTVTDEEMLTTIFEMLLKKVNNLPESPEKSIAKSSVEGLKEEAQKGEEAKRNNVKKWLNFLLEASPDIWEVAIDSFLHPVKGLSTAFQKIAKRAKEEREKNP